MNRCPDLHAVHEGLWTLDGDVIRFVGFPYALRSTLVRLRDGGLLVHSPVQLSAQRRAAVDGLGPVRHLVSPNKLHHLQLQAWAQAWPEARLHAPPGLSRKRPNLVFHAELGDTPPPAWADVLDQCVVRGSFFMHEVVLFHRASATLMLGDLIENHDPRILSTWQRRLARANRMLAPHGTTPVNYRLSFWNRRAARAGLETILAWRPQRVIVTHGPYVERNAEAFLERAFAWALGRAGPGH